MTVNRKIQLVSKIRNWALKIFSANVMTKISINYFFSNEFLGERSFLEIIASNVSLKFTNIVKMKLSLIKILLGALKM